MAPPSNKKVRVSTYKRPGETGLSTKSPHALLVGVSPRSHLSHLPLMGHETDREPRLELGNYEPREPVHDDSAPDWGQFHDGEVAVAPRSPLRREEERVASPEPEPEPEPEVVDQGSPERGGEGGGQLQLTQNTNKDFLQ